MKNRRTIKILLICLLAALPVILGGCDVSPGAEVNGFQNDPMNFPTYPVATAVPSEPPIMPQDTPVVLDTPAVEFPPITAPTETPFAGGSGWTIIGGIATIPSSTTGAPAQVTIPPTKVPTPTPASSLKLGSQGDQVRQVQKKLKELGFYKGSVDGDFGEGTQKAVIAFQKQYKLTADGKVGSQTMEKLMSAKATAKPGTLATATPKKSAKATAKPTTKPSYDENTYLRLGSSGKQVTQMQNRLIELGYLSGVATGQFDAATEAGVIAFQKRNCSYSDGVAGVQTLKALYSSSAKKTGTPAATIGTSLKEGSRGSDVKTMQSRLKTLGYYSGSADGIFGSSTTAAVKAFQKNNGLTVDGKAGGNTLLKLYSSSAKAAGSSAVVTKKPTSTPHRTATPLPTNTYQKVTTAPNGYATLRRGYYGTPVERMQRALQEQGYYHGSIDGMYGESTEEAVKAFQRNKGLNPDGAAGPATLKVLFEGNFPEGS